MITERVWEEMHKAKGYLLMIELYTDRKRKDNRIISYIIILASIMCALSATFYLNRWITIIASIFVAISTVAKEFLPNIIQPESELAELDTIHVFYKEYLQKLENLFTKRYDEETDVNDEKMRLQFEKIVKTEGRNESELNRLCRKMKKKEKKWIEEQVSDYFQRIYNK